MTCSPDPGAAVLSSTSRQRAGRPAEVGPPRREEGARRDLCRRGCRPCPPLLPSVRRRVRRQVAQSRREDHRSTMDVLLAFFEFPAEHLGPPADDQSGSSRRSHPSGSGQRVTKDPGPGGGDRDGVQAARVGPGPLASRERSPSGRPRPRRRRFTKGKLVERPAESATDEQATDSSIHRS